MRCLTALCLLVIAACGSGARNDTSADDNKAVSPELAALDGYWTVVEGFALKDVAFDAAQATVTIGDERGNIRSYRVSAEKNADGSTLLTLTDDSGQQLRWRIALVGDHGKVRMARGDEELQPGYDTYGPEIFRDRAAAQQLASERRRQEVNRRSLMLW